MCVSHTSCIIPFQRLCFSRSNNERQQLSLHWPYPEFWNGGAEGAVDHTIHHRRPGGMFRPLGTWYVQYPVVLYFTLRYSRHCILVYIRSYSKTWRHIGSNHPKFSHSTILVSVFLELATRVSSDLSRMPCRSTVLEIATCISILGSEEHTFHMKIEIKETRCISIGGKTCSVQLIIMCIFPKN